MDDLAVALTEFRRRREYAKQAYDDHDVAQRDVLEAQSDLLEAIAATLLGRSN